MMSISVEKKYIESQFINQTAKMMNEWVSTNILNMESFEGLLPDILFYWSCSNIF